MPMSITHRRLTNPAGKGGVRHQPAIVISGPDQGPAGMGMALDIGGGSVILRVQRVEFLVEPMLGRDPRIDRTADRLTEGAFMTGSPQPNDPLCPGGQRSAD